VTQPLPDRVHWEEIALVGRGRAEYMRHFDLSRLRPGDSVLDVAAGVSSFAAEMRQVGFSVTAADPLYALSDDGLAARAERDLARLLAQLPNLTGLFRWDFHADAADLERHRKRTLRAFLADRAAHPECYITAGLPATGLPDHAFDVVLVSHLLFLYDDRLDYAFHRDGLLELARVARSEVQVYPLADLGGKPSAFVDRLRDDPALAHLRLTVEPTRATFLKGADQRLVVRAGAR
jgi:hypothetical protein